MVKLQIKNIQGENAGDLEVRDDVFAVPAKAALVHQVMVGQLANKSCLLYTSDAADE